MLLLFFFFSSRRRHTRCLSDWSSDVCSSDLVTCHDRFQDIPPILGAVDVPLPEHGAFDVSKLVEAEERVIAGAAKMPIVGCALLLAVGLADGAVHVQDNLPQSPAFPQLIDPFTGGVRKSGQIAGLCQHLGLEP